MDKINSAQWWENYFQQGKWEVNGGNEQTQFFAHILLQNIEQDILKNIRDNQLTICDFGCACGELAYLLQQYCPECKITGIDISEAAICKAKEKYNGIEFEALDIFKSERIFDVIFCSNVLEHFKDPYKILKKLLCLVERYMVILVPYREEKLDFSHCYRFTENDLKGSYGSFRVVQRKVIDASQIKNSYWKGEQLLVVMEKENANSPEIIEAEGTFARPEIWDKVSEDYEIEIDESEYSLAEEIYHIFTKSGVNPPARIIELGCGSGHLSACLAMKGYQVTLLDFSEGALNKAKDTFRYYGVEGEFVKGDIFDLSNVREEYDLVWNSGVMEHFSADNLIKIYKSIMRITKERFIFWVPNPSSISYLLMRYNLQGRKEWPYGMEYLRTNYLDVAKAAGYGGDVVGYAAQSISKWHFMSTFADSENSNMYSDMVDEGLIPQNESYLIAYEILCDSENGQSYGEKQEYKEEKEKIFELSAINFANDKKIKRLEEENDSWKQQFEEANLKITQFEEKNKINEEEIDCLKRKIQELQFKHQEETRTLNEELEGLVEENKKLFEGVKFNEAEVGRYREKNLAIVNTSVPLIKTETEKLLSYISLPGFLKMIRIHAVLGVFKHSGLSVRCKMIVKALLRLIGVKKSFHTENVRMDFKIKNCIYNIQNTLNLIEMQKEIPEANSNIIVSTTEENNEAFSKQEEVIIEEEPKISVLLPVYNHAQFIRSAIEGVQNQTYKNWELVIVDDGSTDELLNILQDYTSDPRIRMYTQDNQRLPNALTNLHNLATGQFVTWTSADNIMEPQMLEQLSNHLIKHPEAVMVFADVSIIDDKGQFKGFGYREMNRDKDKLHIMRLPHCTEALDAESDNYINACFMYRMNAVKALKGQYSADLEGLEDYDFWLRLRAFGEILHIKNVTPLYRYRVHENTMSEDLLKNKLEQHQRRCKLMMDYSHAKNGYIKGNWQFSFQKSNSDIRSSLDSLNYNYQRESNKKACVVQDISEAAEKRDSFAIVETDYKYEIFYLLNNQANETGVRILKGIDIPVLAKKVRQTKIHGLFWEYPVEFANMEVIGCHVDLRNINIEKTIKLLNNNPDKLFSFCATIGGLNKSAEEKILRACKNAIFMGEKETGLPVYLYASWDMAFVPPMKSMEDLDRMEAIALAWTIGKWIMIERSNSSKEIFPFVCSYLYDEGILAVKRIQNLCAVEDLLDSYLYVFSSAGVAKRVIAYLNGIGQDIFVKRPDFELIPKERKFPPKQIKPEHILPEKLKRGYIAIVVDTLDKGGLEQVVAMLSEALSARGMEIRVLCTEKGGVIAETLKTHGIIVEEFSGNRKEFERYIKDNKPLLANTHYAKEMLDVLKSNNVPTVEVIHNMYVFFEDDLWKKEREREKLFNKMIAVSSMVKDVYIKRHGNVNQNKIEVICNCADVRKIFGARRNFVREQLGIPEGSVVFLNVSSIDGRKNQLGILSAFDVYYKTINSNSYLILAGNALSQFYEEAVQLYMAELDSKEHVIKLDYYKEIGSLYNAADVFIMLSYFEGWSIAATEALYCGLPIIHSMCGSALELVQDGKNGILVSNPVGDILNCTHDELITAMGNRMPGNTDEVVRAMKCLTDNLEEWRARRSSISSSAIQQFSKDRMIDGYISCFEEILEG